MKCGFVSVQAGVVFLSMLKQCVEKLFLLFFIVKGQRPNVLRWVYAPKFVALRALSPLFIIYGIS